MRVFKTRWFARYARRERIGDQGLYGAIERVVKEGILQEVSYGKD